MFALILYRALACARIRPVRLVFWFDRKKDLETFPFLCSPGPSRHPSLADTVFALIRPVRFGPSVLPVGHGRSGSLLALRVPAPPLPVRVLSRPLDDDAECDIHDCLRDRWQFSPRVDANLPGCTKPSRSKDEAQRGRPPVRMNTRFEAYIENTKPKVLHAQVRKVCNRHKAAVPVRVPHQHVREERAAAGERVAHELRVLSRV